jgi:hypothetical protein
MSQSQQEIMEGANMILKLLGLDIPLPTLPKSFIDAIDKHTPELVNNLKQYEINPQRSALLQNRLIGLGATQLEAALIGPLLSPDAMYLSDDALFTEAEPHIKEMRKRERKMKDTDFDLGLTYM